MSEWRKVEIHAEHPDHPGWFRVPGASALDVVFSRAGHPLVCVSLFDVLSGGDHLAVIIGSVEGIVGLGRHWRAISVDPTHTSGPMALRVPIDTEHPWHDGWFRRMMNPRLLTFSDGERTIAFHVEEAWDMADLDEQIAALVVGGEA